MTLTLKEASELLQQYPDNIPVDVAAALISRDSTKSKSVTPQALRESIKIGGHPFGWALPPKSGEADIWRYRIETHVFLKYFCPAWEELREKIPA